MSGTPTGLGRPRSGDVVELILDDHRRFESLLREVRDVSADRDAARQALAALHVEEELTILNPTRVRVPAADRSALGEVFARERNARLDDGCGRVEDVRALVAEAGRRGLLDGEL